MPALEFDLLANALDSLAQGIEFVLNHQDNPSKLKVAILLVAQAVELVLKERLRREHWSLIFRKVEQAGNDNAHTFDIRRNLHFVPLWLTLSPIHRVSLAG